MNIMLQTENIKRIQIISKKLQVAGDSNRLKILCYIFKVKRACVSDIAKKLKLSIATVSHHLQILAIENLLISDREGKKICYSLSKVDFMRDLKNLICKYK